ncbi:MAG: glycosyltransferase family 2 protein [Planctomycetota bacterium]|nr:glycosyltransferase family 2 protein [Planctomycetota bacterium]
MISVVIPAHNESRVIQRTLAALRDSPRPGELQIIVVCNGCKDDTARVARAFAPTIRVVETDLPSKSSALNLGDCAATVFPRFYLDADVILPWESLHRMSVRLTQGDILAVAPLPHFDLTESSWPVRAYYQIHMRLPAYREGIGGSGVYGLSEEGRKRFDRFPDVTADDGFVRVQFRPEERATLADCHSIVRAPCTLRELISIKTRSHYGSCELRRLNPGLWVNKGASNRAALMELCCNPLLWPKLLAYAYVKIMIRLRSRRLLRAGGRGAWQRDESSRMPAGGPPDALKTD